MRRRSLTPHSLTRLLPAWARRMLQIPLPLRAASGPKRRKITRVKRVESPELKALWNALAVEYFPEKYSTLENYLVQWSLRPQKRTLASCNVRHRIVNVAQELNVPEHAVWLAPLLYHEMCHAAIGEEVQRSGRKRLWHGPEFRALERRHPEIRAMDNWIKTGGWHRAIRSHRAKQAHLRRKAA